MKGVGSASDGVLPQGVVAGFELIEEDSARHGVGSRPRVRDADANIPAQIPEEVLAVGETGNAAAIEHSAAREIDYVEPLGSALPIPVQAVDGDAVRVTVDQIEIDVEAGVGVPGGGNAIGGGGRTFLEGAHVRGGSDPSGKSFAAEGHLSIGWVAGDVVGNGESVGAVDSLPGSLRRGIGGKEGRTSGDRHGQGDGVGMRQTAAAASDGDGIGANRSGGSGCDRHGGRARPDHGGRIEPGNGTGRQTGST